MRRRQAFTLVEMLVSLALIMFIMAIMSEAFVASAKTFRDLKAAGDLADRLRVTTNTLRRMLYAGHFGSGKLSDGTAWTSTSPAGPPTFGFFRIYQKTPTASNLESSDSNISVTPPGTAAGSTVNYPSYRVTDCSLHFTANLGASNYGGLANPANMNNYFYAYVPTSSPLLGSLFTGDFPEGRYQDPTSTSPPYACQWAEVAFFLVPQTSDTANGTTLNSLYMRQRLLVPTTGAVIAGQTTPPWPQFQVTGYSTTAYPEISGINSGGNLICNRPVDITMPFVRFGMNSTVVSPSTTPAGDQINYSGQFSGTDSAGNANYTTLQQDTSSNATDSQRFAGADLLMTDVVSFEVRVLPRDWSDFADVFELAGTPANPKYYDFTNGNKAFTYNGTTGSMGFDTWSQLTETTTSTTYDYSGWMAGTGSNKTYYDRIPMWDSARSTGLWLQAIQITLRVWDLKTEMTRQVTVVVPL